MGLILFKYSPINRGIIPRSFLKTCKLFAFFSCHPTQSFHFHRTERINHSIENAIRLLQQTMWFIEFDGLTVVHDKNTIRVHDRVQPMGNSQYRAFGEFLTNGSLYETVGAAETDTSIVMFLIRSHTN